MATLPGHEGTTNALHCHAKQGLTKYVVAAKVVQSYHASATSSNLILEGVGGAMICRASRCVTPNCMTFLSISCASIDYTVGLPLKIRSLMQKELVQGLGSVPASCMRKPKGGPSPLAEPALGSCLPTASPAPMTLHGSAMSPLHDSQVVILSWQLRKMTDIST